MLALDSEGSVHDGGFVDARSLSPLSNCFPRLSSLMLCLPMLSLTFVYILLLPVEPVCMVLEHRCQLLLDAGVDLLEEGLDHAH